MTAFLQVPWPQLLWFHKDYPSRVDAMLLKVMAMPGCLPHLMVQPLLPPGLFLEALDHTRWAPAETSPPWNAFPADLILVSVADMS